MGSALFAVLFILIMLVIFVLVIWGTSAYWARLWRNFADRLRVETRKSRQCPRCGRRVEAGILDCEECRFDFRKAA